MKIIAKKLEHPDFGSKNIDFINKAYQDLFYQINEIFGKLKADMMREMTEKGDITIEEAEDFIDKYMYPDIEIEDTLNGLPFQLMCSYKFRDIEEVI